MTTFNKYDSVLASTEAYRRRAITNGNTQEGDGYKYRGWVLVQFTWKNNYIKAKDFLNVDFVSNPDMWHPRWQLMQEYLRLFLI